MKWKNEPIYLEHMIDLEWTGYEWIQPPGRLTNRESNEAVTGGYVEWHSIELKTAGREENEPDVGSAYIAKKDNNHAAEVVREFNR